MPKKGRGDARPQGVVPLLSKGPPLSGGLLLSEENPRVNEGWPRHSVGANQDFNSQTSAPTRLARNPAERTVAREDAVLDVLPPGLHSTGGPVAWIYASRVVIQS